MTSTSSPVAIPVAEPTEMLVAPASAAAASWLDGVLKVVAAVTLSGPSTPEDASTQSCDTQLVPVPQAAPALPTLPTPQPAVAPQYDELVVGSMQAPPHATSPVGHVQPEPLAHDAPVGQTAPALPTPPTPQPAVAPQYCVLAVGSMHVPPQLTSPLAQHSPLMQL
jgi:hypothetical protein